MSLISAACQSSAQKKSKKKKLWPLDLFCPPPSSLWLDTQCDLKVLVDHVADADGRNDLHEVGCQASVESHGPFGPDDVSEQACHVHLRASFQGSWGKQREDRLDQTLHQLQYFNIFGFLEAGITYIQLLTGRESARNLDCELKTWISAWASHNSK